MWLTIQTAPALNCNVVSPKVDKDGELVKDDSDVFNVKFGDLQTLQKLEERVHEFDRTLEANKDALQTLKQLNEDVYRFSSGAEKDEHAFYRVGAAIDRHLQRNHLQQKNIESLLRRIKGRFHLLYNILDLQNSTIVTFHEAARTNFHNLERRETVRNTATNEHMYKLNTEMRDMTHGMRADAISMKIITFAALIYLPITFIAVRNELPYSLPLDCTDLDFGFTIRPFWALELLSLITSLERTERAMGPPRQAFCSH